LGLAAVGVNAGRTAAPALAPLEPVFQGVAVVAVAVHPAASLLPILADPAVLGSDGVEQFLVTTFGIPGKSLFAIHLLVYGGLLLLALLTLRKPLDTEKALAERTTAPQAPAKEAASNVTAPDETAEEPASADVALPPDSEPEPPPQP
ncbi:hypothetical protein OAX78_04150, partial [Planctomycetota bacterium]|nr:hypothetical protein [Planctomycetota bacterium]